MSPFRRARLAAAATAVAGLTLSACSWGMTSSTSTAPTPTSVPTAAASVPTPVAPPIAPDSPPAVAPECADEERAIDRIVQRQLRAFARGDYRAAFALASRSFRESTDLPGFRQIIRTGYPQVADSTSHDLVECRRIAPGAVAAIISVTGADNVTVDLAYRFVREDGGWRIDGATTVRRVTSPTV